MPQAAPPQAAPPHAPEPAATPPAMAPPPRRETARRTSRGPCAGTSVDAGAAPATYPLHQRTPASNISGKRTYVTHPMREPEADVALAYRDAAATATT